MFILFKYLETLYNCYQNKYNLFQGKFESNTLRTVFPILDTKQEESLKKTDSLLIEIRSKHCCTIQGLTTQHERHRNREV